MVELRETRLKVSAEVIPLQWCEDPAVVMAAGLILTSKRTHDRREFGMLRQQLADLNCGVRMKWCDSLDCVRGGTPV